jgi:integrase
VLPLEWRQVDLVAGEVRLATSKNGEGRVFPFTRELRAVVEAQHAEHERLKAAGHICPYVFFRVVAEGRGGPKKPQKIIRFDKVWKPACLAADCPGRIPHDFRRTAARNLVRAGVPQTVAMKLTGHKTDSVFRRYDVVSPNDLRVAVQQLDAAAR